MNDFFLPPFRRSLTPRHAKLSSRQSLYSTEENPLFAPLLTLKKLSSSYKGAAIVTAKLFLLVFTSWQWCFLFDFSSLLKPKAWMWSS